LRSAMEATQKSARTRGIFSDGPARTVGGRHGGEVLLAGGDEPVGDPQGDPQPDGAVTVSVRGEVGAVEEQKITIARREIEERYGKIGDGKKILFVNGVPMGLSTLSRRLALQYSDLVPIDAGELADGTYWLRIYDNEQRKVMVVEFDGSTGSRGTRGGHHGLARGRLLPHPVARLLPGGGRGVAGRRREPGKGRKMSGISPSARWWARSC